MPLPESTLGRVPALVMGRHVEGRTALPKGLAGWLAGTTSVVRFEVTAVLGELARVEVRSFTFTWNPGSANLQPRSAGCCRRLRLPRGDHSPAIHRNRGGTRSRKAGRWDR